MYVCAQNVYFDNKWQRGDTLCYFEKLWSSASRLELAFSVDCFGKHLSSSNTDVPQSDII